MDTYLLRTLKYKLMNKWCNHSSWVSLNVFTVLISVRWTWGVLCWGDRLTAGFADVLRQRIIWLCVYMVPNAATTTLKDSFQNFHALIFPTALSLCEFFSRFLQKFAVFCKLLSKCDKHYGDIFQTPFLNNKQDTSKICLRGLTQPTQKFHIRNGWCNSFYLTFLEFFWW